MYSHFSKALCFQLLWNTPAGKQAWFVNRCGHKLIHSNFSFTLNEHLTNESANEGLYREEMFYTSI